MAAAADPCAPAQQQEFTDRLRAASREVHSVSDALVNAKLLVAFTAKERYGVALGYFWHVFRALEAHCLACCSTPALDPVAALMPRISRTAAFEADLQYLLGPKWQAACVAPPAVDQYLDHLQTIAREDPTLLLAHIYTQHSAILEGGNMIRRMARKAMQLPAELGTKTFEFSAEESPNRLRKEWSQAVNDASETLPQAQQEAVVAEHCRVFAFNNAIVKGFRVGWLDWPRAYARVMPWRENLGLAIGAALCAFAVAKLWTAWTA